MRLFILALLLPAYGFAAVHVEPYLADAPACETQACQASPHDDGKSSLSKLSDTTDDACDHCIAYAAELTVQRVRLWDRPLEQPRAPDAVPRQLLRPPRALPY